MPATVLFSPNSFDAYEADQTLPARFVRILETSGLASRVKGKSVAIKMHVGSSIGYSTIPPVFVRKLVEYIKTAGGDCFITDHYISDRHPASRGYGEDVLGCPVLDGCGYLEKYYYTKPVDFKGFRHVDIAGLIHDADILIDLSHVKGHGSCGYGGACKNLAMGAVTDRTRGEIHSLEGGIVWDGSLCTHCELCVASCNHGANSFEDGEYRMNFHHCTVCQHCVKVCPTGALTLEGERFEDFQTGMALCTKAVLDTFEPGCTFFINFLIQITAVCDCWGMTTPNLVPDIGIMASDDIVAIERASLDSIRLDNLIPAGVPGGKPLQGDGHLFQLLHGKDPYVQIRELEKLGLGTQNYTLQTVL
ncbi:MAG: DUF362 domain-containing protein [Clostridia bacterium]|nr:DUF362 domain-containing protein [Clostridia bacterium]